VKQQLQQLVAVGSITKPFGVRGDVIVRVLSDVPGRFHTLRKIRLGYDEKATVLRGIERATAGSRGIKVKLEGINDRTAAEGIRGQMLFVDSQETTLLPRGTYFVHDIVGLSVVDERGETLGTVADVLHYPASDVYVVRNSSGEFLVPAVKQFIRKIDLPMRTLVVRLIDGMQE
jgi:16S rRNA processing protein RimM